MTAVLPVAAPREAGAAAEAWARAVLAATAVAAVLAALVAAYRVRGRHRPGTAAWPMAERRGAHWAGVDDGGWMRSWPGAGPLPAIGPRVVVRRG